MAIIKESTDGIEITWGAEMRTIPLLTREEAEKFLPQVLEASKEWEHGGGDQFTLPLEVILSAMRRRYPETTIAEIEENFDPYDWSEVWQRIWSATYLNLLAIKGPTH